MLAFAITISDTATPAIARVRDAVASGKDLRPIIGRSATNTVREHLFGLNRTRPNQIGGGRTNYFAQAARATHFDVSGDDVVISINQIGMRLKYFGGTVTAGKGISSHSGKPTRFLTIPAAPEAHGKRASEFKDLVLVYGHDGQPIGLATQSTLGVQIKQTKSGKLIKKSIGRRGIILFRLVRKVTIQPDESILPYKEVITKNALGSVSDYLRRLWQRQKGGDPGALN